MSIEITISHDKQKILLGYDDGMESLDIIETGNLIEKLQKAAQALAERKTPPAPVPFMWEGDEFAQFGECYGNPEKKEAFSCVGGVAKYEFYISDLLDLKKWIDSVIEYHKKNNCAHLAEAQEVKK